MEGVGVWSWRDVLGSPSSHRYMFQSQDKPEPLQNYQRGQDPLQHLAALQVCTRTFVLRCSAGGGGRG